MDQSPRGANLRYTLSWIHRPKPNKGNKNRSSLSTSEAAFSYGCQGKFLDRCHQKEGLGTNVNNVDDV
ncbi:unnamed protein product, partial [Ectocarpus sp. 8 AP-2014]